MKTRYIKTGVMLALSFMVAFAAVVSVAPASAAPTRLGGATKLAPKQDVGKLSLYVYDFDSATKRPISKARIIVSSFAGTDLEGWTDEFGYFTAMLNVGTYQVNVSAFNYKPVTTEAHVKGGGTAGIEVGLGKQLAMGKLALYAWDASGPVDLPLAGAKVRPYDALGAVVVEGITDEFGLFSVTLAADFYTVMIEANDYQTTKAEVTIAANEASVLNVAVFK